MKKPFIEVAILSSDRSEARKPRVERCASARAFSVRRIWSSNSLYLFGLVAFDVLLSSRLRFFSSLPSCAADILEMSIF